MSYAARAVAPDLAMTFPQLKNILFATDFSHCSAAALQYARSVAQHYGSTIRVVHVVASEGGRIISIDRDTAHQKATSDMKKFLGSHPLHGIAHEAWIARGSAAEVLARLIQQENIDLLALGTYGHHRPAEPGLGSVAAELVRSAGCPLLTVRLPSQATRVPERFQRILYATDFSSGSLGALPLAVSLAIRNNSHLILLHVDCARVTCDWLQEAAFEQRLTRLVPPTVERFCSIEPVIELGPVAERIVSAAKERDATVIVMGANGAAGTASAVVAGAHCPVMTVRT
ncbi:MAG: universal stress protein [Terriglobales bacterium]